MPAPRQGQRAVGHSRRRASGGSTHAPPDGFGVRVHKQDSPDPAPLATYLWVCALPAPDKAVTRRGLFAAGGSLWGLEGDKQGSCTPTCLGQNHDLGKDRQGVPSLLVQGCPGPRAGGTAPQSEAPIPGTTHGFVFICSSQVSDTEPQGSQEPHDFVQGQAGADLTGGRPSPGPAWESGC